MFFKASCAFDALLRLGWTKVDDWRCCAFCRCTFGLHETGYIKRSRLVVV